jgi:hypothetical protein
MKQQWHLSFWLTLAVVFTGFTLAQESTNEIVWDATNPGVGIPEQVEAGFVTVTVANAGDGYDLVLYRLREGATLEQLAPLCQNIADTLASEGGFGIAVHEAEAVAEMLGDRLSAEGQLSSIGYVLEEGNYVLAGSSMAAITVVIRQGFEVVTSDTSAPAPQADVTVQMKDFAYDMPSDIKAGEQTWAVSNAGTQVLNMNLYKLAEGKTVDDLNTFLQSQEGNPPGEVVNWAGVLSAGRTQYIAFDLAPGSYAAFGDLLDYSADGTSQKTFALGMIQGFTVTE